MEEGDEWMAIYRRKIERSRIMEEEVKSADASHESLYQIAANMTYGWWGCRRNSEQSLAMYKRAVDAGSIKACETLSSAYMFDDEDLNIKINLNMTEKYAKSV